MPETPSANAQLPFDTDDRIDPTLITAHAGVPLVIELFRRVGAAQVINDEAQKAVQPLEFLLQSQFRFAAQQPLHQQGTGSEQHRLAS